MISAKEREIAAERTVAALEEAGIAITAEERTRIEVADFGLGELERTGLMILTYENNDRYCAKELVLFPGQTCPEHRHPDFLFAKGKRETFRCRAGVVYLYVPGAPAAAPACRPPEGAPSGAYTAFREIALRPGDQYTMESNTFHWFQAGPEGAVVSEFSSTSRDEKDVFSDPRISRETKIIE